MEPAFADTAMTAAEVARIPKFPFLVAAYVAFFVILFVYVVTLHVRQKRLARDVEALQRRAGGAGEGAA